ncbi:MAG: glutamine synthetase adenylyltransferase [Anaerolineae bacterium]|nr:glutamine synthetase adenylyltransferase [Anaerolineae bacterium]
MGETELDRGAEWAAVRALDDNRVRDALASVGFSDSRAAERCLRRIAGGSRWERAVVACLPSLIAALREVANPDRVLVNLERFADNVADRHELLQLLANDPRAVEVLVTLFAGSQFLTEILLRNPDYFERLTAQKDLVQLKTVEQLVAEARAVLDPLAGADEQLDALRRFQRWELLRIGASDLLGLLDLATVTEQLSILADSLVRSCLDIASAQSGISAEGFAVVALGKLGGEELNYSSDIDLLFLAASGAMAYRRLGQWLIDALTRMTPEGFLYRVDMRLRPWGQAGALVTSVDGYIAYLSRHARLWEKQALLKARVIAGDMAVGHSFLRRAAPLIYGVAGDAVRADVRAMKDRIEGRLRRRGCEWGEVKLGQGSIRDVEFVTQYLQLVHGAQRLDLRCQNTLEALSRLDASGILSAEEYQILSEGYVFLRTIEHHLQLMYYQQTHTLPSDPEALAHLARRLGFRGPGAGDRLVERYQQHSAAIRSVYQRYLSGEEGGNMDEGPHSPPSKETRHLERMIPSYSDAFSDDEIARHVALVERLGDDNLVEVEAAPLDDRRWRVTIVAYDYLGELSLICGLLFVYGLNILDGRVFTYEPLPGRHGRSTPSAVPRRARRSRLEGRRSRGNGRRKIVDVFTVAAVRGDVSADTWSRYEEDLEALVRRLSKGEQREAQGELAKRVADALRDTRGTTTTLYPVEIEIDNTSSERYTVLRIDALDTIGFLYEFSNALALSGVYIAHMTIDSVGKRVRDTLYVTDSRGQKITAPERQRQLRAAAVLVKHFTHLLPRSPNPEAALLHFRSFVGQLFMRPDWPDELATLERLDVLEALARLLGVSDFLWEDFLRMQHDNLFPVVRDVENLAHPKSKEEWRAELDEALRSASDSDARRKALNAFKDREMFRVDMRHILGYITEFGQFSGELTDLAEVVVEAAYRLCDEELRAQYGTPRLEDGSYAPMTVCALGKCGGRELGYASDIELMFIFAGNGRTTGPQVITTAEYYERLVQSFLRTIRAHREGIFEVDLRLRPYGRMGSMAVSLEAFRRYFGPGGPAWAYERQALVKLRPIAGDPDLGAQIVALRDAFVYGGEPFDVRAMRAMRERQIRHLVTGGTFNAKFSPGGLVDLEYLVQGLQITYGRHDPRLRLTNTREAMTALAETGILSAEEYRRLRDAHIFLRRLINALRMVRGNARDLTVPPVDSEEFAFLAHRLGYGGDVARLHDDLISHASYVRDVSARLLS